jgi:hypothetical protein
MILFLRIGLGVEISCPSPQGGMPYREENPRSKNPPGFLFGVMDREKFNFNS